MSVLRGRVHFFKPLGSDERFGGTVARAKVLGMPYLHEEEFQVLARHDLIRRSEV